MASQPAIGATLTLVINFTTRVCRVIAHRKNGNVVVLAEPVYQETTGRRLYAEQRFTIYPEEIRCN
jgi:hypothetical protein